MKRRKREGGGGIGVGGEGKEGVGRQVVVRKPRWRTTVRRGGVVQGDTQIAKVTGRGQLQRGGGGRGGGSGMVVV